MKKYINGDRYYVRRDVNALRKFLGSLPINNNKMYGAIELLNFVNYRFFINLDNLERIHNWLFKYHPEIKEEYTIWVMRQNRRKKAPF